MSAPRRRTRARPKGATRPSKPPPTRATAKAKPKPRTSAFAFEGFRASDWVAAVGTGVGACGLFLSTFSPNVALGDAPESVAGVRSVGILHAPGYPSYVLAARFFGSVVAVGSWAFRVNLFSLICASSTVAVVYLLARSLGAGTSGAVIGSWALASCESFWFNAGFAKHYAFSGLLVTTSVLLVVLWQRSGRTLLLAIAGGVLGVGLGAAWQLVAIATVGLVVFLALGSRKPQRAAMVAASGALVVAAFAIWSFVLVRARQDPALNWGEATNLQRLFALASQRDFALAPTHTNVLAQTGGTVGGIVRDFGLGTIALATVGAARLRRLGRATIVLLCIVGLGNLLAVAIFSPVPIQGFGSTQVQGGYLVDAIVVIGLLAALGASFTIDEATKWARSRVRGAFGASLGRLIGPAGVTAVVVITIVPSVLVHYQHATLRVPPLADRYGHRVLASLPPHSALLSWGDEFSFPFLYRQIVDHERPDVIVIRANDLDAEWARVQLTRRLDLGSALQPAPGVTMVRNLIAKLRESRPVFLDLSAMEVLRYAVAYRDRGLVGEVVDGSGSQPITDVDAVSAAVAKSDAEDGLTGMPSNRYPYKTVFYMHQRAHIELAKVYALDQNLDAVERELRLAVAAYPNEPTAPETLAALERPGGRDALRSVLML